MTPTPIEYIRAAIANAMVEDLNVTQIWQAAKNAQTPEQFDANINAIVQARDMMALAMEAQK